MRVFCYEWRRRGCQLLALVVLLAILYFAWSQIFDMVLYGVYDTAPFSEWTWITYLARLSALLLVYPLYCIGQIYGKKERQTCKLTVSMCMQPSVHMGIKIGVIATYFLFPLLLCVGIAFLFYAVLFAPVTVVPFGELLLLTAVFCLPILLFSMGFSMLLGRTAPGVVYGYMALLVFASFIDLRLPMPVDLLGSSILALVESGNLVKGVIAFSLPGTYLVSRAIFTVLGIVMIIFACKLADKKQ